MGPRNSTCDHSALVFTPVARPGLGLQRLGALRFGNPIVAPGGRAQPAPAVSTPVPPPGRHITLPDHRSIEDDRRSGRACACKRPIVGNWDCPACSPAWRTPTWGNYDSWMHDDALKVAALPARPYLPHDHGRKFSRSLLRLRHFARSIRSP